MNQRDAQLRPSLDSSWILRPSPNPNARLRLFCLPHAGGDTWIFRDWHRSLPSFVEVCAIRLPGRGSRIADVPFDDFDDLIVSIGEGVRDALELPFVILGNSMGALIAFELARHLRQAAAASPVMLCVGSCAAPHLAYYPAISGLTSHLLLQELERRYGTSMGDIAKNDELMQLTMPIIRADFGLCETYRYRAGAPLDCAITGYGGTRDMSVKSRKIDEWATQTSNVFVRHEIIGDHFFSVGSKDAFLRILAQDLEWVMS